MERARLIARAALAALNDTAPSQVEDTAPPRVEDAGLAIDLHDATEIVRQLRDIRRNPTTVATT